MNDAFKSQLTALALDELSHDERAAIDAALADAPEARKYAAETGEFCALLTRSLAAPAEAALTDEQRRTLAGQLTTLEAGPQGGGVTPSARGKWLSWSMGLGAAAAAVLITNHLWQDGNEGEWALAKSGLSDGPAEGLRGDLTDAKLNRFAGGSGVGGALAEDAATTLNREMLRMAKAENEAMEVAGLLVADADAAPGQPTDTPANALSEERLGRAQSIDGLAQLDDMKKPGDGPLVADTATDAAKPESQAAKNLFADAELSGDLTQERRFLLAGEPAGGARVAGLAAKSWPESPDFFQKGLADGEAPLASRGLLTQQDATPTAPISLAKQESTTDGFAANREASSLAGTTANMPSLLVAEAARDGSDFRYRKEKSVEEGFVAEEQKGVDSLGSRLSLASSRGSEAYDEVPENPFLAVASAPLSTFSIDVDTAGYANVRRFLNQGQRPPKAAVRIEEMVNYFRYDYPQPVGDAPFSVSVDLADCPWQPQHRLARIGLQGKVVAREQRPAANLVFLVDVSGSMDEPNKLPLVKQSLHLLTSQLKGSDHVAIVTYAGSSGVALPSTSLEQKESVGRAIDALAAGGSTNGASGIQLAYQQARQNFKPGGVNRVLLATDGDFNVGLTSRDELQKLITDEAKSGVFLSVLGYGMGNLKDGTMEMLSDKGNGNYAYIDSLSEARKALGEQVEGTLHTIAKDVKIQIEFNPAHVRNYRLLGYENRLLAKEDFNDDTKDAGEIGAGHSVTALYEIVPTSAPPIQPPVDPLKYQLPPVAAAAQPVAIDQPVSPETMTVKLNYKAPAGATSQRMEVPVVDEKRLFAEAPADFKFATSVAMAGLLLKDSAHKGTANWNMVRDLARAGKGPDAEGYRGEFLQLVEKAAGVAP